MKRGVLQGAAQYALHFGRTVFCVQQARARIYQHHDFL